MTILIHINNCFVGGKMVTTEGLILSQSVWHTLERFSYDLGNWFREKASGFDWSIVSQYDVKAKYRSISRKFLGMNFFHPSVLLTNQKPHAFVSVRQTNQIALFSFVCCFCLVCAFLFQGHTKIALTYRVTKVRVVFGVTTQTLENFRFQDEDDYENEISSILVVRVRE